MPKVRLMADTPKMPCLTQVCSNPRGETPKVPCYLAGIPKMLCLVARMPKMRLMADTPKTPCLMQVCSNPRGGICLLVGIPKMLCLSQVLAGQQMTQVFRGEALMQVS